MQIRKYIQREPPISPEEIFFQGSKSPYWKSIQLFIQQETSVGSQWKGTLEANHQIAEQRKNIPKLYIPSLLFPNNGSDSDLIWHKSGII